METEESENVSDSEVLNAVQGHDEQPCGIHQTPKVTQDKNQDSAILPTFQKHYESESVCNVPDVSCTSSINAASVTVNEEESKCESSHCSCGSEGEFGDTVIRQEIWNGNLPVVFTLALDETSSTLDPPHPCYVMIPRNSYFPLFTNTVVLDHFRQYSPLFLSEKKEIWLETESGIPLKWHYPVGLLFDLYNFEKNLPWHLILHSKRFPTGELISNPSEEAVKNSFLNILKHANYLKHGDGSKVNNLSMVDIQNLWEGVRSNDFNRYWKVNHQLVPSKMKYVPLRLCRPNLPMIQELIEPFTTEGKETSLKDVLALLLPEIFNHNVPNEKHLDILKQSKYVNSTDETKESNQSISIENYTGDKLSYNGVSESEQAINFESVQYAPENCVHSESAIGMKNPSSSSDSQVFQSDNLIVLIQGISPPVNTSVKWLSQNFSNSDNFLYITVHFSNK